MSDTPRSSVRPLKASWVSDFSPHPERIYHGNTPLGATVEEIQAARSAISAARKERSKAKR